MEIITDIIPDSPGGANMSKKQQFLAGDKITKDNQIFGTPNSKVKDGTGNSPNDDVNQKKGQRL